MNSQIVATPQWGAVLFMDDGNARVGVALDFGIRIVHLSRVGMDNLFYVQPEDLSDGLVKDSGWRIRGGHRLWLAPESADSYCPDNDPVAYTLEENGAVFIQKPEPYLQIQKQLRITFLPDGGVRVEQQIKNLSDTAVTGAAWGINTLDAGGTAEIAFSCGTRGGYNPKRTVSLWSDTDLHDPRLAFGRESLTATWKPLPEYLKLGLYMNPGKAVFTNKGQRLTICVDVQPMDCYADNGCNFELYMGKYFMELETLGVRTRLQPGGTAVHTETWYIQKL